MKTEFYFGGSVILEYPDLKVIPSVGDSVMHDGIQYHVAARTFLLDNYGVYCVVITLG